MKSLAQAFPVLRFLGKYGYLRSFVEDPIDSLDEIQETVSATRHFKPSTPLGYLCRLSSWALGCVCYLCALYPAALAREKY